jgi:predicted DCC family thiol-disulfide oxidoreductase YuxK
MVTGLGDRKLLTVLYDRDCGVCTASAVALIRLDRARMLNFEPLDLYESPDGPSRIELESELHAFDERGRWFSGAAATVEVARRIPVLRPVALVARLPLGLTVLELGYRILAANRHRVSALLGLRACPVPRRSAVARDTR